MTSRYGSQALAEGSYRPQAVRRHWINKLGSKEQRPLGIPIVLDRVIQQAIAQLLAQVAQIQGQ